MKFYLLPVIVLLFSYSLFSLFMVFSFTYCLFILAYEGYIECCGHSVA